MNSKPTLLLVDGHSLAFRAFYALNPSNFKTPDGQHTNAIHGFISMLLNLLENEKPTHLAVAFDISGPSFRAIEYPNYKAQRGETPEEFIGQTELLEEALEAMNIKSLTKKDYEADDILASLASQASAEGFQVLVISGDRDTFQLIDESVTVLYPIKGVMNLARMDDSAVVEKYGIHAKQYPDLAALVGETSDNLPGIPGVGPKTAAKWLQQYGDLDSIFANSEEITGKVGESLREHKGEAIRNRKLNHLIRDLELGIKFEDLKLQSVNEEAVRKVFSKLHFRTLTERVLRLRGQNGSQTKGSATSKPELMDEPEEQIQMFDVAQPPTSKFINSEQLLEWLSQQRTVGVDIQEISGRLALGVANESTRYVLNEEIDDELASWLESSSPKVLFDAKGTRRLLLAHSLDINGIADDVLLLAYLLNPVRRNYYVDDIALEHLGINVSREDPNALLTEVNTDLSLDAWLAYKLSSKMAKSLESTGQIKLYKDIELASARTIAGMEQFGIAVDEKMLSRMFDELSNEIIRLEKEAFDTIGKKINLSSPKQLQTVLFEDLGMPATKAVKTGFSTNAQVLTDLFEKTNHPFLAKLLAFRDSTKLKQMIETLLKAIENDGRIHTTYVLTGTSTGRLSSENPNLQNIPIRSARGAKIRSAFVVGAGFETLLTADYSQIEMRIMAHLSEDRDLIEAFKKGEDLHRFVGARIFGVKPEAVTPDMRAKVKAMSYGLVYGLSEYGLARQLRIENAEAKQLMKDYFERFGGVQRYLSKVVEDAKRDGYTTTLYGRRRPFDDLKSKIFQVRENARRAALNAPIQGTAADILKIAMNAIQADLEAKSMKSRILLQVHDELVFEVAKGELPELREVVANRMASAAELSVPLEVQIGTGGSWEQAGH